MIDDTTDLRIKRLRSALLELLIHVDYVSDFGTCTADELVGTVLPKEVLARCQMTLVETQDVISD